MEKENKKTEHKSEKQIFSIIKRVQSFEHAGRGVKIFLKTTHNAWIEIAVGALAIFLGFVFKISTIEWLFVVSSIGAVLTAETFNTAIGI
ncbi:MAG: diacylglycerol kinase family protein [Candidatus Paceibacterota bacterium]